MTTSSSRSFEISKVVVITLAPTTGKVVQTLRRSSAGSVRHLHRRLIGDRTKVRAAAPVAPRTCHSARQAPCSNGKAPESQPRDNSRSEKIRYHRFHQGS